MTNGSSLSRSELNDRIAILRDNIRQLIEQGGSLIRRCRREPQCRPPRGAE